MLITGKNIAIRYPRKDDELKFIQAVKNCTDYHYPWTSPPNNKEQYVNYLKQCANENQASFFVITKDTNELAGVFNLSNIVRGCFQSAYLGYYSLLAKSKKGYMTEALELIVNYAFFNLHLHRIEANIQPDNEASIKLVKRIGFVEEGLAKNYLKINGYWQDHIHFALTLERAQEFWLKQANNKPNPWDPDFEFTADRLESFLKENLTSFKNIKTPKLLDHGWDNDVYLVNDYIFRCPRRKIAASLIERENIALDLLKDKLNIEIPHVQFKFIGPPQYCYPFHGYRILQGTPLYKANLSDQDRVDNISHFAFFLKKLHQIPLHEVLEAGLGPQVFSRTNKRNIINQIKSRLEKPAFKHIIDGYKVQIRALCDEALTINLDENYHVLVHGDLYSKHLLFNDKKLCGVIDWGDVGINHAVIDLAALYSLFPRKCHEEFFNIYGSISDEIKVFAKFLAVHSSLGCLDFAESNKDKELTVEAKKALSYVFN